MHTHGTHVGWEDGHGDFNACLGCRGTSSPPSLPSDASTALGTPSTPQASFPHKPEQHSSAAPRELGLGGCSVPHTPQGACRPLRQVRGTKCPICPESSKDLISRSLGTAQCPTPSPAVPQPQPPAVSRQPATGTSNQYHLPHMPFLTGSQEPPCHSAAPHTCTPPQKPSQSPL